MVGEGAPRQAVASPPARMGRQVPLDKLVAIGHSRRMRPVELKRIRRQLGLTQQALAERLGVDRTTVARWETGARGIAEPIARLVQRIRAEAKAAEGATSGHSVPEKRPHRGKR